MNLFFIATLTALSAITTEKYPDADSVIVNEVSRTQYTADGNYSSEYESWVKILTEKGRREESIIQLDYSRRFGTAGIAYVGVIDALGVEREIDVSATTNESTDNESMSSNIYDPLDRKIFCTIPGLKVGDTVHTKTFRKQEKPRCEGKWSGLGALEWTSPMLNATYEVTAPKDLPLKSIVIRNPLGNVTTNVTELADGSIRYSFVAKDSAQVFEEPSMPTLWTQVQHVRVSTASDWPEISKWYWQLCLPHLAKTTPEMEAKVTELLGEATKVPKIDRIRTLFKFVSQEVRYMGLTMEDTSPGYSPHDVDITFNNRYGVCRDKASLLVAMLKLAGIEAYPVLIHNGAKHDPDVPQPFFNHAIVAAVNDGIEPDNEEPYILMDPTDESAKDIFPAYLSDKSYIVCRPEGDILRTSPVPSANHNSLNVVTRGKLIKDGSLLLDNEICFNGINDSIYRSSFARMKPIDRVKFFEKIVKRMQAGAELIRCEIEPQDMQDTDSPLKVRILSSMPEMVLRCETRNKLMVPFISKLLGGVNFLFNDNFALEKRNFDLKLDTTASAKETLAIDISDVLDKNIYLPKHAKKPIDGFTYKVGYEVMDGKLLAEREVAVDKVEFKPAQYANIREELKSIEADERQLPVFAVNDVKEADVLWLLEATESHIASDKAWVTTNTVVKEVLTYDGKKRSAELKFGYNPASESIELVDAVVSNRNGRVYSVSAKEMNEMDCGWAAVAPRYPASKQLIVNLPSVEIGSVISYTIVTTVTNAPAPYYAVFGFDSLEPLERRYVRVNDWTRDETKPRHLPNEQGQPHAPLWRDQIIISSNRFARVDFKIPELDPNDFEELEGAETLEEIRNWMAKNVKIAGPKLYEVPLEFQLTAPEIVLKERYATRLDYIRTMCALLRGAGYEADLVLATPDADDPEEVKHSIMYDKPHIRAFSLALCRVRISEGGFLGFGAEEKEYFIGTENQYAPIGMTAYDECDYFDPQTCEFGKVRVSSPEFKLRGCEMNEIIVREDGSVDYTSEDLFWGAQVANFRKTYSEILPEERSRLHQSILDAVAKSAVSTGELEADTTSYPAKRKFSCHIPNYVTQLDDVMMIRLPELLSSLPTFTGSNIRQTPFAIAGAANMSEIIKVRFPKGWTLVEHLPESFEFADPYNKDVVWVESKVTNNVINGSLEVELRRDVHERPYSWFNPDYIQMAKDRNRIATSRANRTIVVRKERN